MRASDPFFLLAAPPDFAGARVYQLPEASRVLALSTELKNVPIVQFLFTKSWQVLFVLIAPHKFELVLPNYAKTINIVQ